VWQAYGEVDAVHRQLDALTKKGGAAAQPPLKDAIAAFAVKLDPLREGKGESAPNLGAIGDAFASLATDVEGADRAPTAPQEQVLTAYRGRLDRALAEWDTLRTGGIAALDQQLRQGGLDEIRVPAANDIDVGEPGEGKDLP